jgi:2-polyprenyl-3-methyl-5-hydroxy-6-metoxy-1,4-benzoquinol methylase
MEPHTFIEEVYRRMAARDACERPYPDWSETEKSATVVQATHQYEPYLPADKNAAILDIGFGAGWFLAACLKLGYRNLSGADFGIANKSHVRNWASDRITLYEIQDNIGEFLSDKKERYDYIHMSHVIEHVPKYSLLWVGDALYWSLKRGGTVLLRTPNMEGPCANSSLYVTLSHEYGFTGSNLLSLLDICGFDDVQFIEFRDYAPTLKQRLGNALRWPILKASRLRHRLFGVNRGCQFGAELIVTGKRGDWPPYFDRRFQ